MQQIDLILDNENEIVFNVNVEGTGPAKASCRLMIESDELSYLFEGKMRGNEVTILIPPMHRSLAEGEYRADLEVLVDDRIFVPLSINTTFKKSVKVTAETVKIRKKRGATATLISSSPSVESNAIREESTVNKKELNKKIQNLIKEKIDTIEAVDKKRKTRKKNLSVSQDDVSLVLKAIANRRKK